jgi:hypothetical protein
VTRAPADNDRTRAADSRARDDSRAMQRPEITQWSPAHAIECPKDPRFEYRWIAEYVNGAHIARNVHMKEREGYVRVRVSELPDDFLLYDEDTRGDGYTRYGGLILMRLPIELYWQRQAYYLGRSAERLKTANQLQGVAGRDAVEEDRGTRTLTGEESARALRSMAKS